MAARLGALALAVAMVAGALFARSRIDQHALHARLTCATELAAVCAHLGAGITVTEAEAGLTADRLAQLEQGGDPGLDGWLVPGPWPQIVDAERKAKGSPPLFAPAGRPLAASPLVVVVEAQRSAALKRFCHDPPAWSCVGQSLTKSWKELGGDTKFGPVKAAAANPASSAEGVAVLAALAADLLQGGPSVNDNQALQALLAGLHGKLKTGSPVDGLNTVLTAPAEVDTVATTEVEARSVLDPLPGANRLKVTVLYPSPMASIEVELGLAGAPAAARHLDAVLRGGTGTRALGAADWKVGEGAAGLPEADVLGALRRAWVALS